ncbi:MAG: 30S ribosome-binding factor RbfA [Phycisphaerales bacterium]|nr:MAG: 30S ribosome-binding factor RbfA [Phycisphaerales bacterium]
MRTYRLERVASTVREVVSEAIQRRLNDPRIVPMTSVTRVEVSGDLMYAKVHVSVMGTPGEQRRTLGGLERSTRYIQSLLAKRLTTRHCPRLRFVLDPSIQRAMETNRIIDEAMAEYDRAEHAEEGTAEAESPAEPGEPE